MPRERINFSDLTMAEIEEKVIALKEEIFNLRFRNAMRQLDDPLVIRYKRRDLARCLTALSEHKKGLLRLAGSE